MQLILRRTRRFLFVGLFTLLASLPLIAQQTWVIGPFARPAEVNPIISPLKESTFTDPILKAPTHWEALHTFNPAAIVRNGKVYVLYRAEDDSGAIEIGGHTSRLGLADSVDGIALHAARRLRYSSPTTTNTESPRMARRRRGPPHRREHQDGHTC